MDGAFMKEFGSFLQEMRELSGLTQLDLGQKLGHTSAQFVSNIERGISKMPLKSLPVWSKAINVEPKEMFHAWERVEVMNTRADFAKVMAAEKSKRRKS